MQAALFTFIQKDSASRAACSDWNAEFAACPGQSTCTWAKYLHMSTVNPLFVLDKSAERGFHALRRAGHNPPRIKVLDAVACGTSGAEFSSNTCAEALAPSHHRARRGASIGLLAAQPRRSAFETSRALLLLPPSLVRSGALRSDIYSDRQAWPPIARPAGMELPA